MLTIRRLYVYSVSYLGLVLTLGGLATLGRVLLEQLVDVPSSGVAFNELAGGEHFKEQTALGVALVAVGLPVWALHLRIAARWLADARGEAERGSALRRLYLYAALVTTALMAATSAHHLLYHTLAWLTGLESGESTAAGLARPLPALVLGMLFWAYHRDTARRDRQRVGERGASATLRRWYVYGLAAVGFVMLGFNLAELVDWLWRALVDPTARLVASSGLADRTLIEACTGTLVALALWLLHRAWAEAAAGAGVWFGDVERRSTLRKVYAYGAVGLCVAMVLASASGALQFGLKLLLGVAPAQIAGESIVVAVGRSLAHALVFGVFWLYHWQLIRRDGALEPERGRQAAVRRIYFYLVALVALAVLVVSFIALLQLLLDLLLFGQSDVVGLRSAAADWLSALLIALPVWLAHWRTVQRQAAPGLLAEPDRQDELRSVARRLYLYLVVFAAVTSLIGTAAITIYRLVSAALGLTLTRNDQIELSHLIETGLVAGLLLWYHGWLVLRADRAALRQPAGERLTAVLAGLDAEQAAALRRFAQEALPGARLRIGGPERPGTDESSEAAAPEPGAAQP